MQAIAEAKGLFRACSSNDSRADPLPTKYKWASGKSPAISTHIPHFNRPLAKVPNTWDKLGESWVVLMTYEQVKSLKPEDFKRLCGVRLETFKQMLDAVRSAESSSAKPKGTLRERYRQAKENKRQEGQVNSVWKTNC